MRGGVISVLLLVHWIPSWFKAPKTSIALAGVYSMLEKTSLGPRALAGAEGSSEQCTVQYSAVIRCNINYCMWSDNQDKKEPERIFVELWNMSGSCLLPGHCLAILSPSISPSLPHAL